MTRSFNLLKFNILLYICFSCEVIYANDCIKLSKTEAYELADMVFIGEVSESSESEFEVKVIEVFKGSIQDTLLGVINNELLRPKKGTTWLFYASTIEGSKIAIGPCSGSKSFEFPHGFNDISTLIPPPKTMITSPNDLMLLEQILKVKANNEMYYEIFSLRNNKFNEQIYDLSLKLSSTKEEPITMNLKYNTIVVLLILILFAQLFLVFKVYFKKI